MVLFFCVSQSCELAEGPHRYGIIQDENSRSIWIGSNLLQFTAVSSNACRPHEPECLSWSRSISCFKREARVFQENLSRHSSERHSCSAFFANSLMDSYWRDKATLLSETLLKHSCGCETLLERSLVSPLCAKVWDACPSSSAKVWKLFEALLEDTLQDHSPRRSCRTPLRDTPVQLILDSGDSSVGFREAERHSVRHFCGASSEAMLRRSNDILVRHY